MQKGSRARSTGSRCSNTGWLNRCTCTGLQKHRQQVQQHRLAESLHGLRLAAAGAVCLRVRVLVGGDAERYSGGSSEQQRCGLRGCEVGLNRSAWIPVALIRSALSGPERIRASLRGSEAAHDGTCMCRASRGGMRDPSTIAMCIDWRQQPVLPVARATAEPAAGSITSSARHSSNNMQMHC
jgi:hypothetical protein